MVANGQNSDACFPLVSGVKFSYDPKNKQMPIASDAIFDLNGNTFDLNKEYTVAISNYIFETECQEFALVQDASVKKLNYTENDEENLLDIVNYFLQSFQKTEEQWQKSPLPSKNLLKNRMEMFKAGFDNRCQVSGFMFMNPEKDGRMVRLGDPDQELIVIEDQLQEIEIE